MTVKKLSSLTRGENQNVKTGQKMAAIGVNWAGTTCIYIVSSGVKVNADAFIKLILTKMVRHDFPRLCDNHAKDVILHMDSAPSHVALTTVQWLKNQK